MGSLFYITKILNTCLKYQLWMSEKRQMTLREGYYRGYMDFALAVIVHMMDFAFAAVVQGKDLALAALVQQWYLVHYSCNMW